MLLIDDAVTDIQTCYLGVSDCFAHSLLVRRYSDNWLINFVTLWVPGLPQSQSVLSLRRRPGIAQELLGDPLHLERTTKNIVSICRYTFENMASSGCLGASDPLRGILIQAALDVQELESLNSMIKTMVSRSSTTITLELLASRVCARKLLSTAIGDNPKLYIAKAAAAQLAKGAYTFFDDHKDTFKIHTGGARPLMSLFQRATLDCLTLRLYQRRLMCGLPSTTSCS